MPGVLDKLFRSQAVSREVPTFTPATKRISPSGLTPEGMVSFEEQQVPASIGTQTLTRKRAPGALRLLGSVLSGGRSLQLERQEEERFFGEAERSALLKLQVATQNAQLELLQKKIGQPTIKTLKIGVDKIGVLNTETGELVDLIDTSKPLTKEELNSQIEVREKTRGKPYSPAQKSAIFGLIEQASRAQTPDKSLDIITTGLNRLEEKEREEQFTLERAAQAKKDREDMLRLAASLRPGKEGPTEDEIADMAEQVASGQIEITAVPVSIRPKVSSLIKRSGKLIVSARNRDQINTFSTAEAVLDDIEKVSEKVNTGTGVLSLVSGAGRRTAAALQEDPDAQLLLSKAGELGLLIRALGEKGVLTEGDISRAGALIPSIYDSQQVAKAKIASLRTLMSNIRSTRLQQGTKTFRKNPASIINEGVKSLE